LAAAAVAAAAALLDCALRVFSEQVAYTTHDQKPKVLLLLFPFFFFYSSPSFIPGIKLKTNGSSIAEREREKRREDLPLPNDKKQHGRKLLLLPLAFASCC